MAAPGGQARISAVWRYPLKGFAGSELSGCLITEGKGIRRDRQWGVVDAGNRAAAESEAYPSHRLFRVLKGSPAAAKLSFAVDDASETLRMSGQGEPAEWQLSDPCLCAKAADAIAARLGWEGIEMIDHGFSQLWDFPGALLSLVNVGSVEALSQAAGVELDARRFRANILVEGLEPWKEEDWIGSDIMLGSGVRLRVVRETPRCLATCVSPDTAVVDAKVPLLLRRHYGHANMGVLAVPVSTGEIAPGDKVQWEGLPAA